MDTERRVLRFAVTTCREVRMTKESFLAFCLSAFSTVPDCPFTGDAETVVLRHAGSRKWFALVMKVSRRKFGGESDEKVDIVNLKLPVDMFGSFGREEGVYPAYHMNKLHWISVLLPDAADGTVDFLTRVSYEVTRGAPHRQKETMV